MVVGRVTQVVVLYSNDFMGISLNRLNIGHFRWLILGVAIWTGLIVPLMEKLSGEKKDILIMGDFNINLLNYHNDKDTTTFLDTMFSNSFSPFITLPTMAANTSETLTNNIFYEKPLNNLIAGNLYSLVSDHLIQFPIEPSSYIYTSFKGK